MLNPRAAEIVVPLHEWASQHARLIEAVWLAAALPGGDWPAAEALTRKLYGTRRSIDVEAATAVMPSPLGRLQSGRVILTVRGASYYGGAKSHLRHYVRAVALAVSRYADHSKEPLLSVADLQELDMDRRWGVQLFERILEGEAWALSAIGNAGARPHGVHRTEPRSG